MSEIMTIELDSAKYVFQVHGVDAEGATVLRKRLRRGQLLSFFSLLWRCEGSQISLHANKIVVITGGTTHRTSPARQISVGTNTPVW